MKKFFLVLFVVTFQTLSYGGTCSYLDSDSSTGFLEYGDGNLKKDVESYILESFDKVVYPSETPSNLDSCESIPVKYSCTNSDSCTQYCIASSVTEYGTHINFAYKVRQCRSNNQIEVMEKSES